MSDLVERLREYGANPGIPPEGAYELALKAADEIERLQAAIMRYKSTLAGTALLNFEKHFAREARK